MDATLRPYDAETDRAALWALKRAFETELGAAGGDEKATAYDAKLTDDYRRRWLTWVDRCVADDPRCVTVAERDDRLVGYVFLLPERLAFVWDAAVVNELYVAPERRGTGVADDLLEAATELAREQDLPLDRLLLDVDPGNDRARAFYDRHGFEPWGEIVARELRTD
ncbi:GNAT family N-acetyltransferase [Halobacteriales archaeon QS_8_69_73]|nr:MAG: GNAT family N-acetyltransferase [Halobacteriales archaeon QS_8_69_73]